MDAAATDDDAARRISRFCVGMAVASFSAFVGWIAFAFSAKDFYADWWQGWAEAHDRLADNPGMATVVGVSAVFVGFGVGCMVRAVFRGRFRRRT